VENKAPTCGSGTTAYVAEGLRPDEIVVFVRSAAELPRAEQSAAAGIPFRFLDSHAETTVGSLSISTMHLAKGLEFRAVAVMGCDDEVIPLQERIETATDASELEDVYNTERQLLYVACTRARDCLLLTSAGSPSEFLRDMQQSRAGKI
jgi:superfamily I DNA/RNA helicase